jgi:hypothetical protein
MGQIVLTGREGEKSYENEALAVLSGFSGATTPHALVGFTGRFEGVGIGTKRKFAERQLSIRYMYGREEIGYLDQRHPWLLFVTISHSNTSAPTLKVHPR